MEETQLRELLGKGLPKIAVPCINAMYPIGFKAVLEPARDYAVEAQLVGSQLIYTRNFQVYSFLVMDASQIFKLGLRVFPKSSRLEIPKLVVSANGEALNTIVAKLAYLVGKFDEADEVTTTPPIVINCSGPNRVELHGADCLFLTLGTADLSMLVIAAVQKV